MDASYVSNRNVAVLKKLDENLVANSEQACRIAFFKWPTDAERIAKMFSTDVSVNVG